MRPAPVDQDQRTAAVFERDRNVVIQAGAGTGKTSTLVRRLVQLVAPEEYGQPNSDVESLSMRRIAAITFTRRAAGELSLRIREELLKGLTDPGVIDQRLELLRGALADLDTAYVGTIHSFADRLLRMKPVESRLSPKYEVVEDEDELLEETYQLLLRGVEQGTLKESLAGSGVEDMAVEATQTVVDVLRGGILAQTRETAHAPTLGLDALVAGFIQQRDVPPLQNPVADPDLKSMQFFMQEFVGLTEPISGDSEIGAWLKEMSQRMMGWMKETDPIVLYREIGPRIEERKKQKPTRKHQCNEDNDVWRVWKALIEGKKNRDVADTPLAEDLTGELRTWLGQRLVRLSPVVVALHEKVKARRGVIDQIDLLLKLRDLLRDNLEVRAFYQGLFDHIMVDEFQDTDPLQAQVVQFLCEKKPEAAQADDVDLTPGKLTLVGDPKQSIYRFRRADVEMYDRVTRKLGDDALRVELEANFRSVPAMTEWFNARFPDLLGVGDGNATFEPDTGRVFHRDLEAGRLDDRDTAVHVLPLKLDDARGKGKAGEFRELEAEALPNYLRWLVEESGEQILAKGADESRPIRYEDVCVLAVATTNLPLLFTQLDRFDVPYAAGGGKLFLGDALQKQFLLALRAIADPDDGVAEAALMRPPFFATDLRDLFESKGDCASGEGQERVQQATVLIESLRARRLERSPGETARELLEQTGLGRMVALGPNGGQRLQRLREICHLLEVRAVEGGLDYDGITAQMREWVAEPAKLEAPRPVAEDAVQVMTVHQSKGLEFPVVVIWDGRALLQGPSNSGGVWNVAPNGKSWSLSLSGLEVNNPSSVDLTAREKLYLDEERRRLVYVAATRARDLLVIPLAGQADQRYVCGVLLDGNPTAGVISLDVYEEGKGAPWSNMLKERVVLEAVADKVVEERVEAAWNTAAIEAGIAQHRPVGVSSVAHELITEEEEENEERWKDHDRKGRYGREFGTLVHRAMEISLRDTNVGATDAVARAANETGFRQHLDEAVADVDRGLAALLQEGLSGDVGQSLRLEYPVSGPGDNGTMLLGYVDLVHVKDSRLTVIDFKTDQPPDGEVVELMPAYVEQVKMYGQLLSSVGLGETRCGLLFTGDGGVRWV
jgi:ATP-dependent helicase/nuclease subunit A